MNERNSQTYLQRAWLAWLPLSLSLMGLLGIGWLLAGLAIAKLA